MHETGTAERDGQSPTTLAPSPRTGFVADTSSGLSLDPPSHRSHPTAAASTLPLPLSSCWALPPSCLHS